MSENKKRPLIGVRFDHGEDGIGDAEYILNLLFCLNLLPDGEKPEVLLLSYREESFEYIREESNYPYLDRMRKKMSQAEHEFSFDLIFPTPVGVRFQKTLCWFPDFQDKYFPEIYSEEELVQREFYRHEYFQNYRNMVFSSKADCDDFHRFYPESRASRFVLPFATRGTVPIPEESRSVLIRYGLPNEFFYCPSTLLWHKQYKVIIDAIAVLSENNANIFMVFSGKNHDDGNNLQEYAAARNLAGKVAFLGDIPKNDRVALSQQAVSVLHIDTFDGWSNIAEEIKLVSQHVLATHSRRNLEQLNENAIFFEPENSKELADLMRKYVENIPSRRIVDYRKHQLQFANSFIALLKTAGRNARNYSKSLPDELVHLVEPYKLTDRFLAEADFYGAADIIAGKLGYEDTPSSYSTWIHACSRVGFPWKYTEQILWSDDKRLWSNRESPYKSLVDSRAVSDFLSQNGLENVEAVGVPMLYVDGKGVQRRSKSVLLMPAHSINTVSIDNRDEKSLLQQVDKLKRQGYYVAVCLHQDCQRDGGLILALENSGVDWFAGALYRDMNSLQRMRNVFEYFEIVGSDAIGSHFYYSQLFGAKFYFYSPYFEYKKSSFNKAPHLKDKEYYLDYYLWVSSEAAVRERCGRYFCEPSESVCDKDMAEKSCGKSEMVNLQELAKLLGWS